MAKAQLALAGWRDWRPLALIGLAVFASSFALFHYALPVGVWVTSTPEPVASAFLAGLTGMLAMVLAAVFATQELQVRNVRMRVALDNMSMGLCMFDGNERLVISNQRYVEIYQLGDEFSRSGISLLDVLNYRAATGSFAHDPQTYRRALIEAMARGETTSAEVKSPDGRTISVINRPMPGGGWVGTHEDITERRDAERERLTMQEQQQRRTTIEQAIASTLQGPLMVKGYLVAPEGGPVRLCSALLESYPPQCGEPSLVVEGLDLATVEGLAQTSEPDLAQVTWSDAEISILGDVEDGVITVSQTSL